MEDITESDFQMFLSTAHRLSDLAGTIIRPYFRQTLAVENKFGGSHFDPVTIADREAESEICERLAEEWPLHGRLGEEHGEAGADREYCWIIDPIDGTRSFIMGSPLWGTLIGLTHKGTPVLGMMDQPFTGERFWSERERSCYRGPEGAHQLKTRPCAEVGDALLSTTSPELFQQDFERDCFEKVRAKARMTRYGGDCYAYCLLAAGHIDMIIEAGLKSYDILPLIPIIERAGGKVTNWRGESAAGGGQILASGDLRLHQQMLNELEPFSTSRL